MVTGDRYRHSLIDLSTHWRRPVSCEHICWVRCYLRLRPSHAGPWGEARNTSRARLMPPWATVRVQVARRDKMLKDVEARLAIQDLHGRYTDAFYRKSEEDYRACRARARRLPSTREARVPPAIRHRACGTSLARLEALPGVVACVPRRDLSRRARHAGRRRARVGQRRALPRGSGRASAS